jgi:solute carrier family 8 (sodium/calcium exchanger)
VTAAIGDIASHLGCFVDLKDSLNAITLVAMGTALPDMFASKLAAVQVLLIKKPS